MIVQFLIYYFFSTLSCLKVLRSLRVVSFYNFLKRIPCPRLLFINGNRAEWRPIRSVIIRMISKKKKIGRSRSGSPICLITGMIEHTELDDTKSYYQLIILKFEEKNRQS